MTENGLTISHDERSLRARVVTTLRHAILSGRFAPGKRLTEKELCALLDVSRASLREALQHLVAEGLIENVPHRGPVVASIDQKEAAEIYEVREILEAMAGAGFARNATESQLARLEQAVAALKHPKIHGEQSQLVATKNRFYEILFEGCGNRVLARLLIALNNRVTLLRRVSLSQKGRLRRSIRELDAIVDAIRQRDADAAFAACQRHVRNAAEAALAQLAKIPLPNSSERKVQTNGELPRAAPIVLAVSKAKKQPAK